MNFHTILWKVEYLDLIYKELKNDNCKVDGWDITLRIVANDATPEVISRLKSLDIPYSIYNDPKPDDYYLNRVYRCWNYAGETSDSDNICFVNFWICLYSWSTTSAAFAFNSSFSLFSFLSGFFFFL